MAAWLWLNRLLRAVENVPQDISELVTLIDWAIKSLSMGLTGPGQKIKSLLSID